MGMWKKIGGVFSTLSGVRTVKKQARYLKDDLKQIKSDFTLNEAARNTKRRVDHWNEVIKANRITRKMLTTQYARRRFVAFLILAVMLAGLGVVVALHDYGIGIPALVVATLLYIKNGLRLYQIRHRYLCTARHFLRAVRTSLYEILPLALPEDWDVIAKEVSSDVT